MARKKTTTRKKTARRTASAAGKHLVIVESPAKAKTINKYLGRDYVVQASVGHVRDLPARAPKGSKQPVPGVDLENHFQPTYDVLPGKKKVVTELKKAARQARDVWFATDLDREGEAIAWHIAQELDIPPEQVRRVVFNAITRSEIEHAFANPHVLDLDKVNAQQARRILDRIVGYQVSPLLWKKVARGLSAGRVQSVAVRLIVEREDEIRQFIPDEYWRFTARLSIDPDAAPGLAEPWKKFISTLNGKGRSPTVKECNAWLAEHGSIRAELAELQGGKFELRSRAEDTKDLSEEVAAVCDAIGLIDTKAREEENPKGRGPAATVKTIEGRIDPATRYRVRSVETKRTTSRPPAPFITSTLQMAASGALGFGASRTMRTAQELYEGVNVPGEGQVGLITYMRTDSTHLSGDALAQARTFIKDKFGDSYLPEKPNFFGSSNKAAQEAHEAIRPTDVNRHPEEIAAALTEPQRKLYRLIWNRFVACQMTPAQWDATNVMLERSDRETGAVLKATGRVLVFDGFYRVAGLPTNGEEQILPELAEGRETAPFSLEPEQLFTSPPPRYTEASLVKTLESEGIGRPSTYAQIINVIQERKYVEQIDRRFYATDLGEVVTEKLVEAFPRLMDLGYTRQMEAELDKVAEQHHDWTAMLEKFYARFSKSLDRAHDNMVHAKAESRSAPYRCPQCGGQTCYRFGKNGRFLSCSRYPKCDFAAPIDREGRPMSAERVNVACPEDGSAMELRSGRFGRFLASVNYPQVKYVINLDKNGKIKYPAQPPVLTDLPCPKCESPLNLRRGKRGPWLSCSTFPKCKGRAAWSKLEEAVKAHWLQQLEDHERAHPQIVVRTLDGKVIPEGTPVADLIMPGGVDELEIHPEAAAQSTAAA
ncbi:MAG: type I DNA topoisomerase [Phycisphaerales bacterium]|nr:MAG: type I DNA topoisomerase [Phycisphaerales bacterium]